MAHEKYDTSHHLGATPEERIRNRLRPSAEPQRGPGAQVKVGDGPNRTITTIHQSANTRQHGPDHKGEGNIFGEARGPANPEGQIE
jgi:hypothetical protein